MVYSRKYVLSYVSPDAFTNKYYVYNSRCMEQILHDMGSMTADIINKVADELPAGFPGFIAEPIFEGMHRYRQRLLS